MIRVYAAVLSAVIALFAVNALRAADEPPYDTRATDDRTHIAHVNAHIGGGSGGSAATSVASSSTVLFSGSSYTTPAGVDTPTSTVPEAEEHIAVDPTNGKNLIAAISDFAGRPNFSTWNTTKYVISTNYGTPGSWVESYVEFDTTSGRLLTGDNRTWEANSDPVVAIGSDGYAYLANLYFNSSDSANGLYVSVRAPAAGTTLFAPSQTGFAVTDTHAVAVHAAPTTVDEDKEWIAVDNSSSQYKGTVYVSWTRFSGNSDMIMVAKSTDHGATWLSSGQVQVSPGAQNGAVQGSQIAVGPAGEVYVVYHVAYVGNRGRQFLAKSIDGGASFGLAVAISPLYNEPTFNSSYRKNSFAALAVDATSPAKLYVVYADQPSKQLGAQVEFIRSIYGNDSFSSTPLALNDLGSGQQFMPAITVDRLGTVHASWFDTRNNSSASRYDIYATRSSDYGATFGTNQRLTPASINAGSATFIGDYAGICAGADDTTTGKPTAHPVWTSGGFNGGRLQTTTLVAP